VVDSVAIEPSIETIPIVCKYPDVLPEEIPSMPPPRGMDFCINLAQLLFQFIRPYIGWPQRSLKNPKIEVEELLEKGYTSLWRESVLFVKKNDRSLWFCIDYRELTKITIKNRYLLPQINNHFDQLWGAVTF